MSPYAGSWAFGMVFMLIEALMTAALAQLMQPLMDRVLGGKETNLIVPFGFTILAVFTIRGLSSYMHSIIMNKVGQRIVGDIQKDLFSHFMSLDLAFFHANPSGQLISRVVNDVSIMRMAVSETTAAFGKSLLTLFFLIIVMIVQDWKLAICALVIFPFATLFVANIGRKIRKVSKSIQGETAILSDRLSQIFQGIRQVKAYGAKTYEGAKAGGAIDKVRNLMVKSIRIGNLATPVNEILIGSVICSLVIYGGYRIADGTMSLGQLVAFLTAFTLAYEPMKKLARLNNSIQMGIGAADRVFEMMDMKPTILEKSGAPDLDAANAEIKFDNVSFLYDQKEQRALDGISFTARPGKVTALVGPSGGGKSTIINLIPRFYDPQSGSISVNGSDLKNITIKSLRRHIALVSQDITIFDDTVEANIAYGAPDASEDDIHRAAKAAAADAFINELENGYKTRLGEDGVKLSGGQRQRIAIARAILRNAPILLLDEATSALDNESEKAVQAALQELEKGRTTIVIAHRLSTVQTADQIIVLDKGQIVEQGRHEELLKNNGLYARMYKTGLRE
ncbi:MAG TPA: ABC transporter ATP-binding protein [Alphaproteobacteria bacterium]|nr:ABC transporter ATP-binding protein [Alphaproteobacteria bacterium]